MADRENLFSEFPPTTKAEWLELIHQDLGNKPWSELQWRLSEDLLIDPFFHPDDRLPARLLNGTGKAQNSWEIGEYIFLQDGLEEANRQALLALEGGAEALLFQCEGVVFAEKELAILLAHIDRSLVSLHFEWGAADALRSSLPALETLSPWRGSYYLAGKEKVRKSRQEWDEPGSLNHPEIRSVVIDGRPFYEGAGESGRELAQMLGLARAILDRQADPVSLSGVNGQIKLLLALDTSYFVSIAKIRALKLLWANLAQAYNVAPAPLPEIEGHFTPYPPKADPHTNLIRAATQALSAVIGGVDRLFVLPAGSNLGESTAFTRRMARNVQHLLKMESYLDRVIDPAAGSYYLEKLTDLLAEQAWGIFQKKQEWS